MDFYYLAAIVTGLHENGEKRRIKNYYEITRKNDLKRIFFSVTNIK